MTSTNTAQKASKQPTRSKNGNKTRIVAGTTPKKAADNTRTIKYHPGPTTIPRNKIREAVKAVVSKAKSA